MSLALAVRAPESLAKARGRLAHVDQALAALRAEKPTDVDAIIEQDRKIGALSFERSACLQVVAHWEGVARAAERAEADRRDKARHAEAQKEAAKHEALVHAIHAENVKQAARFKQLAEHKARIAAANRELSERFGYIPDAEERVRRTPGRTIPARYEEREVWRLPDGSQATFLVQDEKTGEMVGHGAGVKKVKEQVLMAPEQFIAPIMPPSLCDTVVLPGLRGGDAPIWDRGR